MALFPILDIVSEVFTRHNLTKMVSRFLISIYLLTRKAPRKILEQTTIYFCFLFFREDNACPADDSHVMSSIIPSENYVEHALKMSSASRDWGFKG